jgi:hypothetical protein
MDLTETYPQFTKYQLNGFLLETLKETIPCFFPSFYWFSAPFGIP